MTERLVSKLHVALLSYDEREIRVRKNYLEEQNPAICCVCFHSGEELLFHLLSNALRAVSPGGQIKIRLTRDDEDLYLIVEDDGCGLPTGENWMENRRRFLGGVQAGLLLCRRYCAHMGWVLSLTPRDAGSGTRAEVRIPLAGTMFPIEGSVELHTIHPALTTADGLRWQILRELALLSDKME